MFAIALRSRSVGVDRLGAEGNPESIHRDLGDSIMPLRPSVLHDAPQEGEDGIVAFGGSSLTISRAIAAGMIIMAIPTVVVP